MVRARILLVDGQPLYLDGVASCLVRDARFEVVGKALSGSQAIELARRTSPNLVILDIDQPTAHGLIAEPAMVAKLCVGAKVIVLTANKEIDAIQSCFANGASAYILKDIGSEELVETVVGVLRGNILISTGLPRSLLTGAKAPHPGRQDGNPETPLTTREKQVLGMVAAGLSSLDTSRRLQISPRTVETHRSHLMRKLHVQNVAALVRRAILLGLLKTS